jgi:hypothetical protein
MFNRCPDPEGRTMRHIIFAIAVTTLLAACGSREPTILKIGEATYRFPHNAVIDNRNKGDTYVNFAVGQSEDGRLTRASIKLEFNQEYNRTHRNETKQRHIGQNETSFPEVRLLNHGANSGELYIVNRPWGVVLCNRKNIKLAYSCGATFVEAGAQWQVLFHFDKLDENSDIIAEARTALRTLRA